MATRTLRHLVKTGRRGKDSASLGGWPGFHTLRCNRARVSPCPGVPVAVKESLARAFSAGVVEDWSCNGGGEVFRSCRGLRSLVLVRSGCGLQLRSVLSADDVSTGHPVIRLFEKRGFGTMVQEDVKGKKHESEEVEADGEVLLVRYLGMLKNYEREGVPTGAGTDSDAGFDLERMQRLLDRLGNPLSAYKVVHVAGTKGKGSTVNFIASILRAAGLSVGTYTSPHITSIRERITAGKSGDPISALALRKLLTDLQATINEAVAAESGLLTHFEVLTALAFTHFAREGVDVAVIETGLGGARDATNVIPAKNLAAAVIVGIGCEHLAALGGSLEAIALAKAGIIKQNCPVIVGRQTESLVEDIIRRVAAERGAPVISAFGSTVTCKTRVLCVDPDHSFQSCDIVISSWPDSDPGGCSQNWEMECVKLRALGAHQQENAITATSTVLTLRSQGWDIPDSAIRTGLEATEMTGRFQVVGVQTAEALCYHSTILILDGAHTEGSAIALSKTLRDAFPMASLALVVAMASDKDQHAFAEALLKEAKPSIVVTTRVPVAGSFDRSTTAQELASCWIHVAQASNYEVYLDMNQLRNADSSSRRQFPESRGSLLVSGRESICAAIKNASALLRETQGERQQVVCVTGSLHAVAATLSLFKSRVHGM